MGRVYNFSAGPAVLPEEVLKEAADEMLDYKVHRNGCELLRSTALKEQYLIVIRDTHKLSDVLFSFLDDVIERLGTVAHLHYAHTCALIITGQWAKKAYQEAQKYGEAVAVASSADKTFSYIPDCSDLDIPEDADYVYICENNTIYGTKYKTLPNTKGHTLVADVSSCFLSERVLSKVWIWLIKVGVIGEIGRAHV